MTDDRFKVMAKSITDFKLNKNTFFLYTFNFKYKGTTNMIQNKQYYM